MINTPIEGGFYMPAEWEKHEGTWLQWPHDDTHPGSQMRLEHIWLMMTEVLHQHEVVHIVASDERGQNFNGWGERYPYDKDTKIPAGIAEMLSIPVFTAPITLEGGGIEVNGKGTLLATRSSIVNPNRNPDRTLEEIEEILREYLCVDHFIWLSGKDGLGDTDFHIDGAARFVDEQTVLYSWTDDTSHPRYPYFKKHLEELEGAVTESGKPLILAPVPVTEGIYATRDAPTAPPFEPMPSLGLYANYYVANNVVLVPVYGDANDARAKAIIAEHFPGREIVGILAHMVAELGGMIHCVTQQQPAARVKEAS
ncbi:MAG: hypothetical protein B6I35_09785 [Anaerolineaceae bacterium 4572_32.2]|nr:MAG: hypothetical protein B6I35_09785 [Anaerolineaceae bacterium 4572_32.2]